MSASLPDLVINYRLNSTCNISDKNNKFNQP